jgi:hypothetical protein
MPFYGRSELDENNMNIVLMTFNNHREILLNELKNGNNKTNKEKQRILNELKTLEKLISSIRDFNFKYISNNESS